MLQRDKFHPHSCSQEQKTGWGDGSVGKHLLHVSTKGQVWTQRAYARLGEAVHVYDPMRDGRQ